MLNCKTEDLQPLVPPSLEALRSCVGLLRRFSGRYICGLRSGELIEEFCRRMSYLHLLYFPISSYSILVTRIPLDAPARVDASQSRPPWIRPVRKKTPSLARDGRPGSSSDSQHGSPEGRLSKNLLKPFLSSPLIVVFFFGPQVGMAIVRPHSPSVRPAQVLKQVFHRQVQPSH